MGMADQQRIYDPQWLAYAWQEFLRKHHRTGFHLQKNLTIPKSCQNAFTRLAKYLGTVKLSPEIYFMAVFSECTRRGKPLPWTTQLGSAWLNGIVADGLKTRAAEFGGNTQAAAHDLQSRGNIRQQAQDQIRVHFPEIAQGVKNYLHTRTTYKFLPEDRYWIHFTSSTHAAFIRYYAPFWQLEMDSHLTDAQVALICHLGSDPDLDVMAYHVVRDAYMQEGNVHDLFISNGNQNRTHGINRERTIPISRRISGTTPGSYVPETSMSRELR